MKHLPSFVTSLLLCIILQAETSLDSAINENEKQVLKNLVFTEGDEKALTLDLYLPSDDNQLLSCIIVIQGGGFKPQNGQRFKHFAEFFADNGYAAALISYRGRPDAHFKETIADTKAAVRYIRKISGKYNINPDRIGAMGRSAGGTLATFLAVTSGDPSFEGDRGHADYSSDVQAAVSLAGPNDFVSRFSDAEQRASQKDPEQKAKMNADWIGEPFSPSSELWLAASTINHIDVDDPPVMFLHSRNDPIVPWHQSQLGYNQMIALGVPAEIHVFEKGGHGLATDEAPTPNERMLAFFQQTLELQ